MEYDTTTTGLAFLALVAVGAAVSLAMPMSTSTVLMMVLPSLVVYGLATLALGVKHGEHRAGRR